MVELLSICCEKRANRGDVEQAIKLLTIVLSIYEFSVGEFPGCA